ncbi:vWA domain-containing protein [Intrasporangium sp. YIM S08009]|uniref:vWA domain-containing protein n=1 Tax=Intrasporangium zincisolvens TaxID=3080018 RepID=UPI002B05A24F|nr:VWA domain-containing protein [Intrasporangium sp. YIM S08009]
MTLTWPWMLVGLAVLPVLVVAYRRLLAGRAARVRAMAADGLVLVERRDLLRHLGPTLLLAALALLVVALTRPVAAVAEPHREGTVVLAFDVSNSMAAADLKPTRLEAAKAAARGFVAKQPPSVRIAVVAFGSNGVVTQRPTDDRTAVLAAIARLKPQSDTSLAGGILAGLSAIAGRPVHAPSDTENGATDETPVGYYGGTAIVLLTDGENTSGSDPQALADYASAAGVRIDPVGLGTPAGTVIEVDGFSIATALDESALRKIADTTGGTYRRASDAATLAAVYDSIQLQWTTRSVPHEITSLVAGVAALLLLAGASVTVLRQGRVV